jgi:PKHD-type hydroxylase
MKEPNENVMMVTGESIFNHAESDTIISIGESAGMSKQTNYFNNNVSQRNTYENIRKSSEYLLPEDNQDYYWIFHRLVSLISECNKTFMFDIEYIERVNIIKYDESLDYYKPHHDILMTDFGSRKLTFSIQLSNDNDYVGGNLNLHLNETPLVADRKRGSATVFPAFVLHEVTPVTSGVRYALVGHVHGPKFR